MRLTDHVTLNFNNNLCTAAVFLDIEKAFDTTRHHDLYKLLKLNFSVSVVKFISSFPADRKFRFLVEGEMSTPGEIQAGVPQGSVLSSTLYNLCIDDAPQAPGTCLALFCYVTCIYATDHKEDYVLRSCSVASHQWSHGVSAGT